jgi:hypothetical protein
VQLLRRPVPIVPSLSHFISAGFIDPNQSVGTTQGGKKRLTTEQKQKQILVCQAEQEQQRQEDEYDGLSSLFQHTTIGDQDDQSIMVLKADTLEEDPTKLITTDPHPAETNWYLLDPQDDTFKVSKN